VIFSDDGSTDKTKDIIKSFLASHAGVLIENTRCGLLAQRAIMCRKLLETAGENDRFMFIDADDEFHDAGSVQRLADGAAEHDSICFSNIVIRKRNKTFNMMIGDIGHGRTRDILDRFGHRFMFPYMFGHALPLSCAKIIRDVTADAEKFLRDRPGGYNKIFEDRIVFLGRDGIYAKNYKINIVRGNSVIHYLDSPTSYTWSEPCDDFYTQWVNTVDFTKAGQHSFLLWFCYKNRNKTKAERIKKLNEYLPLYKRLCASDRLGVWLFRHAPRLLSALGPVEKKLRREWCYYFLAKHKL
jgi:glycosyltransferase involved in cell wall biosynthesis